MKTNSELSTFIILFSEVCKVKWVSVPVFCFSSIFGYIIIKPFLTLLLILAMIDFIVVLFSHDFYFIIIADVFLMISFLTVIFLPVAVLFIVIFNLFDFCLLDFFLSLILSVFINKLYFIRQVILFGCKLWYWRWIVCCIIQYFCCFWSWSIFYHYLYLNLTLTIRHYFTLIQLLLFQPT